MKNEDNCDKLKSSNVDNDQDNSDIECDTLTPLEFDFLRSHPRLQHLERDRGPKGRKLPANFAKKALSCPQPATRMLLRPHSEPNDNHTSEEPVYLSLHELNHYDHCPKLISSPIMNEKFRLSFTEELKSKVRRKRFGCLDPGTLDSEEAEEEEEEESENQAPEGKKKKSPPATLPKPDFLTLVARVVKLEAINQEIIRRLMGLEELVVNLNKEIVDLKAEVVKGHQQQSVVIREEKQKIQLRTKLIIPEAFQQKNSN